LRIRLFDYDHLLALNSLDLDVLLLVVRQRPSALRLRAHALNRVHHIALLSEERVAQISGPLNVIRQPLNDILQRSHRLNARIPRLLLHSIS
jgi:hypothetical protein